LPNVGSEDQGQIQNEEFPGGFGMKRLLVLILVLTLLVITGTLVSADGRTRTAGTALSGTDTIKHSISTNSFK
jgi:hypothetical protein